MRAILTVLWVLITCISTHAQKIRFTNSSNQWMTRGTQMAENCPFQHLLTYGSDTLILTGYYKPIKDLWTTPYVVPLCPYPAGESQDATYWVREDTVAEKVYYRIPNIDTMERLLYDYNLVPGDSITYKVTEGGCIFTITDSVVDTGSIVIGGVHHRTMAMQSVRNSWPLTTSSSPARAYEVVEGMGATNNPLFPAYYTGCNVAFCSTHYYEYYEKIKCFSQGSYYPVIHAAYYICGYYPGADTFINSIGCVALEATTVGKNCNVSHFSPNPSPGIFSITGSDDLKGSKLIIYNDLGRAVVVEEITGNYVQADLQQYPDGIYFAIITDEGGNLIRTEKLVKM